MVNISDFMGQKGAPSQLLNSAFTVWKQPPKMLKRKSVAMFLQNFIYKHSYLNFVCFKTCHKTFFFFLFVFNLLKMKRNFLIINSTKTEGRAWSPGHGLLIPDLKPWDQPCESIRCIGQWRKIGSNSCVLIQAWHFVICLILNKFLPLNTLLF